MLFPFRRFRLVSSFTRAAAGRNKAERGKGQNGVRGGWQGVSESVVMPNTGWVWFGSNPAASETPERAAAERPPGRGRSGTDAKPPTNWSSVERSSQKEWSRSAHNWHSGFWRSVGKTTSPGCPTVSRWFCPIDPYSRDDSAHTWHTMLVRCFAVDLGILLYLPKARLAVLRHGIQGTFGVRASREVRSCTRKPNDRELNTGPQPEGQSGFALALESGEGTRYHFRHG
jgi:hypothetical protein